MTSNPRFSNQNLKVAECGYWALLDCLWDSTFQFPFPSIFLLVFCYDLEFWEFITAILLEVHTVCVDTDIHPWPSDLSLLTTCLVGLKVWSLLSNAGVSCSETSISKLHSSLVAQFWNCIRNFEIGTQFGNWQNAQRNFEIAQVPKKCGSYMFYCDVYLHVMLHRCKKFTMILHQL